MKEKGSWCGETHIQKATYFLQVLLRAPLEFEFILYKHGPFSFDLSDEITAMRADSLLQYQLRPPYGPSLFPTEESERFLAQFPKTLKTYARVIQFVAENVGILGVADLERLATALYVTFNKDDQGNPRGIRITELKPHITIDEAILAVEKADSIIRDAREKGLSSGS
ncbi:Uncharacterised protein [uncultured archaeon]|nr:Uncharacterised protein [uncultured archaeon]